MRDWRRGFVYCVTSAEYIPLAAASMDSLRQFHSERAVVYYTPDLFGESVCTIKQSFLYALPRWPYPNPRHKTHPHFLTKNLAFIASPFEQTIFLDADTIVRKPLDELWTNKITIAPVCKG